MSPFITPHSLLLFLLFSLQVVTTTAQWTQCTRDCIIEWCWPVCGSGKGADLPCTFDCHDDCKTGCDRCKAAKNCPEDINFVSLQLQSFVQRFNNTNLTDHHGDDIDDPALTGRPLATDYPQQNHQHHNHPAHLRGKNRPFKPTTTEAPVPPTPSEDPVAEKAGREWYHDQMNRLLDALLEDKIDSMTGRRFAGEIARGITPDWEAYGIGDPNEPRRWGENGETTATAQEEKEGPLDLLTTPEKQEEKMKPEQPTTTQPTDQEENPKEEEITIDVVPVRKLSDPNRQRLTTKRNTQQPRSLRGTPDWRVNREHRRLREKYLGVAEGMAR
ncbi:hypothetical protein QBC35DRAFT_456871 [Podospora australis]|uniref:Uncharacterized protein n=1 Tax=Podospora australis TaxID=1536484 RepID=A0AAN6WJ52_9PEZI|nr:hypothetical protein QBC35DRAFT_456871 [Podospora australis]